ncbi:MAG: site-2 protease family protein, partial [Bacteroidota bacterium]
LMLLPIWLIVITVHELGHTIAGFSQNFELKQFIVGPFIWRTDKEGKLNFEWNTQQMGLLAGAALMAPQGEIRLASRFRWYAAGGPLASLLFGLLLFILPQIIGLSDFVRSLVQITVVMTILIGVLSLIPTRVGGMPSDGMRLLTLSQKTPTAQADLMVLRAFVLSQTNSNLDVLPIDELMSLSRNESVPSDLRASNAYYAYTIMLQKGDTEEAYEQLEVALGNIEQMNATLQSYYYLEAALFHFYHSSDLETGKRYYDQVERSPVLDKIDLKLAEAAIHKMEGRITEAQETVSNLESLRKDSLLGHQWELQAKRLNGLRDMDQ